MGELTSGLFCLNLLDLMRIRRADLGATEPSGGKNAWTAVEYDDPLVNPASKVTSPQWLA